MAKTLSFKKIVENIDEIIEKLETGDLSLEDSIKEYEKAMKYINNAKKILNSAEGKLLKVIDKDGEIEIENFNKENEENA
ncbi:MAG: exodeoxyribonuclease VII small subunit [Fusobacterium perfoetens]|uniref:exodeoxyribonuclease VII small subunit n=1 Tax=Fusobacterium perfoetens TaxID=852 RepID=UPI0023F498B4|nr:exodeoxyribonuclease VII small subunit [Fusobacterium perfoetens]MCI6152092.1 exodeoxyribonuclease VII small subunit [Fusobacterium perfoetens]MDY3238017.1 exodeoxyribonuclease VII small subunit [Fusobacterium perfoetens]